MDTVVDGPVICEHGPRRSSRGGASLRFSALSIAADEVPLDKEELYGFLHFRIDTALKAQRRGRWIVGWIYNTLSGQSATHIPLSGTHLRQTLACAGLQAPKQVVVQGRYSLRLDYALRAYETLKKNLGQ